MSEDAGEMLRVPLRLVFVSPLVIRHHPPSRDQFHKKVGSTSTWAPPEAWHASDRHCMLTRLCPPRLRRPTHFPAMSSSTKYGRTKRTILPPPNRGMLQLDRSKFVHRISCVGVRVDGASAGPIGNDKIVQRYVWVVVELFTAVELMLSCTLQISQILSIPRMKTVVPDPSTSGHRLVLLDVPSEGTVY